MNLDGKLVNAYMPNPCNASAFSGFEIVTLREFNDYQGGTILQEVKTAEDFLDTYYIFVGDFDDDEYLSELFFSLHGTLFFTMDNQDDRSFLLEDESSFSYDFYYIYYML